MGYLEAGLIGGDICQRIGRFTGFNHFAIMQTRELMPMDGEARVGRQANKRVTPETFATLHGFEEEGVGRVGQLEIERKRCFQIGQCRQRDGNTVIAFGSQALEGHFGVRRGDRDRVVQMRGIHDG